MDNGMMTTDSAPTTAATQQAGSTGPTLRPRKTPAAPTKRAGQAKPTRGKGKKPACSADATGSRRQDTQSAPAGLGSGSMPGTASQEIDHPSVAHPICMVTAAPKVEDISIEGLTRWFDLRLKYEEIMRARCVSSGEDLQSVMRSIRNSFDASFLETLCETKWDKSNDELTNEFIWDWIMKTVRNFKNIALQNIVELFQDQLVMSMTKSDIDARVIDYFHLCNSIMKTNGLTALFSEEDETKKSFKGPAQLLTPRAEDSSEERGGFSFASCEVKCVSAIQARGRENLGDRPRKQSSFKEQEMRKRIRK
ncbi:unnamed protein product [Phytophthora fragariaefolia]|uniref:Unnamed protein product n=1 Tax=Phytophthora fragariaefolia TaxID=1490495 RepID=A0A9W7CYH0_9STRA|nr:unnamed protein product [Phytophthora fragariaefolia]